MDDILDVKLIKLYPQVKAELSPHKAVLASSLSFLISLISGLLGIGGGEFRLPVLILLLGLPVTVSATANLIVGLLTVFIAFVKRLMLGVFDEGALGLIVTMSVGSIFGACAGATITGKVGDRRLRLAVGAFLIAIGLKFLHGALVREVPQGLALGHRLDVVFAALFGALIGVVSGAIGVAAGELRIPTFVYFFGISIKLAGTASLAVSIPTVAAGAFAHKRIGHLDRRAAHAALVMGLPALAGAYAGASLVPGAADPLLKALLGAVLLLSAAKIVKFKRVV